MQKTDRVLWEQELGDHMSQHPDLQNLPRFASPWRVHIGYLLVAIMIWLTMMGAGVAGWLIGLYMV